MNLAYKKGMKLSLILTVSGVALFLLVGQVFAYDTPSGIPDPGTTWGALHPIDTAIPVRTSIAPGWFEGSPRVNSIASGDAHDCYYIDNSDPAATDSSNTYGSPALPRRTVPSKTYAAGSYIEIHGGTNYSGTLNPRGEGSDTNAIWFVGVDNPVLSGKLDIGGSSSARISYLLFDGIRWEGTKIDIRPRFTNNVIDHIAFRKCLVSGNGLAGQGGVSVGASGLSDPTRTTQDIVIYDCEIAQAGDKDNPGEEVGVYPSCYVTRFWILDSSIHDHAEDGFGGSHSGQRTSTGYYIGRNQIYGNVSNGIDIKQMGQVVISECDIRDAHISTPNQTGSGEAIVLHYSGDSTPGATANTWKDWPEDVSVLFCTIHDSDFGVVCSTVDHVRIIGNVFYDIKHSTTPWDGSSPYATGTAIHMRGVRMDSYVVNNTIYDCDNGIQFPDSPSSYNVTTKYWRGSLASYLGLYYVCVRDNYPAGTTGITPTNTTYWQETKFQIWGNLISSRAEPTGRDVYICGAWSANTLSFDRNLIYSQSGEAISFGPSTLRNLAWMKSNTSFQRNGLTSNPLLANPVAANFTLQPSSPRY